MGEAAMTPIAHGEHYTSFEFGDLVIVSLRDGYFTSSAGHLLVWDDTVHVPSLQFTKPHVTWEFDGDRPGARAARKTLLERLTGSGYFVAGAHLDSPGIGHVTRSGEGYELHYVR
jgi:hypothetical protein